MLFLRTSYFHCSALLNHNMQPNYINEMPLDFIISESMKGNHKTQQVLYRLYAPVMYKQCLRYTKSKSDAEDLLQESFIKIFANLDKFRGEGSFEGWLKKIILRTAFSHLRSTVKKVYNHQTELSNYNIEDREINVFDTLAQKHIVHTVTKLPIGCRTVFTMYVIEGYNHREIAGILGCSEGCSKSQLSRSRVHLQKMLQTA